MDRGKVSLRTDILRYFDNWREAYPLFPVRKEYGGMRNYDPFKDFDHRD
jgi:hypothetical protein